MGQHYHPTLRSTSAETEQLDLPQHPAGPSKTSTTRTTGSCIRNCFGFLPTNALGTHGLEYPIPRNESREHVRNQCDRIYRHLMHPRMHLRISIKLHLERSG